MNWLQTQAQENPQKLFIQVDCQAYSYMDVYQMVQVYSQALLRERVQPHERILIYLPSGIEMVEIILPQFVVFSFMLLL